MYVAFLTAELEQFTLCLQRLLDSARHPQIQRCWIWETESGTRSLLKIFQSHSIYGMLLVSIKRISLMSVYSLWKTNEFEGYLSQLVRFLSLIKWDIQMYIMFLSVLEKARVTNILKTKQFVIINWEKKLIRYHTSLNCWVDKWEVDK